MRVAVRRWLVAALAAAALQSPAIVAAQSRQAAAFEAATENARAALLNDPAKALVTVRLAERRGEGGASARVRLTADWIEGEALRRLGRTTEAGAEIDAALAFAQRFAANDAVHGDLLQSRARLDVREGDYRAALRSFRRAGRIFSDSGEDRRRAAILQDIGALHADAQDYPRMLLYYDAAHRAYPEDPAMAIEAHARKAEALQELGRLVEAQLAMRTALGIARRHGRHAQEARLLADLAGIQLAGNHPAEAGRSANRALLAARGHAAGMLPYVQAVMARLAHVRGDDGAALAWLERSYASDAWRQAAARPADTDHVAYEVYRAKGRYREAMQRLAAHARIEELRREKAIKAHDAMMAARFEATDRELHIARLSARSQASASELTLARNKVLILSAGSIIAILLAFITLAASRVSNRNREALRTANAQLLHVSRHDGLTGLMGRNHFRESLEQLLSQVRAGTDQGAALMLLDLDHFKQVNDQNGHLAGDTVLAQVATRLREGLGEKAIIGRLGGDEFAAILPQTTDASVARRLAVALIARISERYAFGEADIYIGASIGIAMLGTDGETSSLLTTNADLALYEAKRRGRGASVLYRPAMRKAIEDRSLLESDLANALRNGELKLHYQPIVDARTGAIAYREALMRWDHPERGLLYPDSFIPLAESKRLIQQIGAWLVRTACLDAAQWDADVKLALNISTLQLGDTNFLKIMVDALASSGFPADRVILELNESIFTQMSDNLTGLLQSLRLLGVGLALDHFGRGNSSLSHLEDIDFALIKIDRDFVQSAAAGLPRSMAIVSAIVSLARSLDFQITAEGIETSEQAQHMRDLGCAYLQGFLFGRPLPQVVRIEEQHTPRQKSA